jgi:class 3 adenylate cyclase
MPASLAPADLRDAALEPISGVDHRDHPGFNVPIAHGRRLAASILGARLVALDGADHFLLSGDPAATLQAIATFLDHEPEGPGAVADRILATVLFVDLVDSTRHAQVLGDQRWTARLDRFHSQARAIVEAHRGRLVNTTGDGVLATFDGPGRGVRAAGELREAIRSMELTMRAGLHTAEIQRRGADIAGIGVHIAGRVASAAHADEIWVSRTVTDLVAGTGLRFEPRGEHELRGIDEPWMLYAATV